MTTIEEQFKKGLHSVVVFVKVEGEKKKLGVADIGLSFFTVTIMKSVQPRLNGYKNYFE
jgi:hypothetical protein